MCKSAASAQGSKLQKVVLLDTAHIELTASNYLDKSHRVKKLLILVHGRRRNKLFLPQSKDPKVTSVM